MNDPIRRAEKAAKQAEAARKHAEAIAGLEFKPWPKISRLNRDIVITEKLDGTNAAIGIEETTDLDTTIPGTGIQVYKYRVYAQSRTRIITPGDDNYGFAAWVEKHREALIDALGVGLHFGEWWGCGINRGYGLSERRFSLFNTAKWGSGEGAAGLEVARREGCTIYSVPVLYTGPWTGMYGYKDETAEGAEKPWLTRAQMENWDEVRVQYEEVEKKITEYLTQYGTWFDPDAEREAVRTLFSVNPRPRYAPNFILEWLKRNGSFAVEGFMNPEGICIFHGASSTVFKATIENDEQHKFEVKK